MLPGPLMLLVRWRSGARSPPLRFASRSSGSGPPDSAPARRLDPW